jgi:hypothetical protein
MAVLVQVAVVEEMAAAIMEATVFQVAAVALKVLQQVETAAVE